jgi:hypothetical protein
MGAKTVRGRGHDHESEANRSRTERLNDGEVISNLDNTRLKFVQPTVQVVHHLQLKD